MKQVLFASLGAVLLSAGFVLPAGAAPVQATEVQCPLSVSFGSYAMGIDQGALKSVRKLLARDRGVRNVSEKRWGREGEITLCAHTRSARDTRRLFSRVRALFPAKPRGPLTVETAGGLSFHAPRE